MSVAWSEWVREQLDQPLRSRHFVFALLSVVIGFPLSLLWSTAAALRMRNRKHRADWNGGPGSPLVVSIGNVALGGTGKSPIVRAIARLAFSSGFDVAILARGYGQSHGQQVIVHCAGGQSESRSDFFSGMLADECLEHAFALGSSLTAGQSLWVGQGPDRQQLFDELVAQRGSALFSRESRERPFLVLLDDGLAQTRLPVHFDVVVWDPEPLLRAPRACVPFGPYRVGWPGAFWAGSLPRADVLVWSRCLSLAAWTEFKSSVDKARRLLFLSDFNSPSSGAHEKNTPREWVAVEQTHLARVLPQAGGTGFSLQNLNFGEYPSAFNLLTGLARPQRFVRSFHDAFRAADRQDAVSIGGVLHLPDHGALNLKAIEFVGQSAALVISLKDLCRWWNEPCIREKIERQNLYVLCLEIELKTLNRVDPQGDVEQLFPLNAHLRSAHDSRLP